MRLELTGRHIIITPALRKVVDQRLAHVTRMLNDSIVSVQVVITKEKSRVHAEATLHARREHFLHGEATGRDGAEAVAGAFDKIDRQAQKLKGKWTEGKRRGVSAAKAASLAPRPERAAGAFNGGDDNTAPAPAKELRIVRARRYDVKSMSVDDAAHEVGGDESAFVVFRNASTDTIAVLFRRPDGKLGLIEPEA